MNTPPHPDSINARELLSSVGWNAPISSSRLRVALAQASSMYFSSSFWEYAMLFPPLGLPHLRAHFATFGMCLLVRSYAIIGLLAAYAARECILPRAHKYSWTPRSILQPWLVARFTHHIFG